MSSPYKRYSLVGGQVVAQDLLDCVLHCQSIVAILIAPLLPRWMSEFDVELLSWHR